MTTTQNTLKHVSLRETLLKEVSQKPCGSRLKPIKEIMEEYSVSQATVDRALGYLRQNGYIESFVGRGTFVSEKASAGNASSKIIADQIDMVVFSDGGEIIDQGFHADLIATLNGLLGQSEKWLRVTFYPRNEPTDKVLGKLQKMETKAVVLFDSIDPKIGDSLRQNGIPFVQVIPYWPDNLPNSINVDNRGVVTNWLDCLTSHGHRKIAYLHGVTEGRYNRDMSERLLFFYEEAANRNIPIKSELITFGGAHRQGGYEGMKRLLGTTHDFTAVIINDHSVAGVYDALAEEGLTVGRDVSVIGTDDLVWAPHMTPPLTTVRISRMRLARMIIKHLEELQTAQKDSLEPEYLPVELIERQSVISL